MLSFTAAWLLRLLLLLLPPLPNTHPPTHMNIGKAGARACDSPTQ